MADLGHYNRLKIRKRTDIGLFLEGDQYGDILLPKKFADETMQIGDVIDVFLYNDSEDRIIATTLKPKAQVGECAYLKVIGTSKFGAFLDWGLPKDLLVPFSEQQKPMEKGFSYTVFLFLDTATDRIAASTRLEQHLSLVGADFQPRQAVDLLIYGKSDLGFKAVINGTHLGQLYANETFQPLHYGESVKGFIRRLRADGKIDLTLQLPAHQGSHQLDEAIIQYLQQNQGVSTLTDKSPPDEIYRMYGVSKTNYKKALGHLYRQRRIVIEKHRISLAP